MSCYCNVYQHRIIRWNGKYRSIVDKSVKCNYCKINKIEGK